LAGAGAGKGSPGKTRDPGAHREPQPDAAGLLVGVETDAVVPDRHHDVGAVAQDREPDPLRLRVFDDVGQQLRDRGGQLGHHLPRQPDRDARDQVDRDLVLLFD
jgi:hypothetical protein